ncbi:MAG: amino acid-binding protein [Coriobacteriia bacterium]|nr:amino acid-binding protein [Coriobacteriia bacterium]
MKQLSVFLENAPGHLARMTRLLGEAGHNMYALMTADTADYGVVRVICDDPDAAAQTLRDRDITAQVHEVCAVAVPDRPGGLSDLLDTIAEASIDISYCYCFVHPSCSDAVTVFRLSDSEATVVLETAGYRIVELEDFNA